MLIFGYVKFCQDYHQRIFPIEFWTPLIHSLITQIYQQEHDFSYFNVLHKSRESLKSPISSSLSCLASLSFFRFLELITCNSENYTNNKLIISLLKIKFIIRIIIALILFIKRHNSFTKNIINNFETIESSRHRNQIISHQIGRAHV